MSRILAAAPMAVSAPDTWVTCDPTRRKCDMRIKASEWDRWVRTEGKPERPQWHSQRCPQRADLERLWEHINRLQKVHPDLPVPTLLRMVPNLHQLTDTTKVE